MRTLVVLLAATLLSGCTSTVLAEPVVHVSPYMALYQLRGKTSIESFQDPMTPGPVQSNSTQLLRQFGQDRHREDVGLRIDVGDGFGGIRGDYYRLDMGTSRSGELTEDWGRLLAGDRANIYAEMDDFRLGYIEPLAEMRTEYRDEELRLQFGAGATVVSRNMTLQAREESYTRAQDLEISGNMLYLAMRARATWKEFSVDLDYAVAPEQLVLSGDVDGLSQDLEARLTYRLPQRDLSFFAGVRYSVYSASGTTGPFQYDADLTIDGLQLGVTVSF